MKTFEYTYLKTLLVPSEWLDKVNTITKFNTLLVIKENESNNTLTKLRKSNAERSAECNVRLENVGSLEQMQVDGYLRAYEYFENYSFNVDNYSILQIHNLLLKDYSSMFEAGIYQLTDNVMLETDLYGSRKIRIMPLMASDTQEAVDELYVAYNAVKETINPLLIIPCFIMDFLCIHPFSYANGRVSRFITKLLLEKFGYNAYKYLSQEEYILDHIEEYFDSLQLSSEEWNRNKNDNTSFIEFFLNMLEATYTKLGQLVPLGIEKKISKAERIEKLIKSCQETISKKEISLALPDISITTIEVVLSDLVKNKKIDKFGANKNCRYKIRY